MILGPFLYVRFSSRFKRFFIINGCFAVMIVSGLLVCVFGGQSPYIFAATLVPAMIATSCVRPPSTYLLLQQQSRDTGSASSLITAFTTAMGSVGMILISVGQRNFVLIIGWLNILIGLLCGGAWLIAVKRSFLDKT